MTWCLNTHRSTVWVSAFSPDQLHDSRLALTPLFGGRGGLVRPGPCRKSHDEHCPRAVCSNSAHRWRSEGKVSAESFLLLSSAQQAVRSTCISAPRQKPPCLLTHLHCNKVLPALKNSSLLHLSQLTVSICAAAMAHPLS